MKKVFLTGASGFIGKHLALALARRGDKVHVLVRQTSDIGGLDHPNIKLFYGALHDTTSIEAAMKGCNCILHLAGTAKMWMRDSSEYYRANVEGTRNVLSIAQRHSMEKIIYASTAGVLPPVSGIGQEPVSENSPKRPELHTQYEKTKNLGEEEALRFYEAGLPIVIVYPTKVFGPGTLGDSNTATTMIKGYITGHWRIIPGSGRGAMNYVYIDDAVAGIISALEMAKPGERYIIGGENASYDQFFRLIGEASGKRRRLFRIPYPIIRLIAAVESLKTKWLGLPPLITSEWVRKIPYNWSKDITKARKELHYEPLSLREGIGKTIEWLRETGQI